MQANKTTHQKGNEIHIRPAKLGDICVLLEPTNKVEIDQLRQHQLSLQAKFGGTLVQQHHLTCQRFASQDKQLLKNFQKNITSILATMKPFSLTALSLQTLYLPIRQTNILKWNIEVTDELRQFVAAVEQALTDLRIKPLYKPGFVSSLLAALEGVPDLDEESLTQYRGFPHHLYHGERMILSQICGPNEFKTLASIPLSSSIDPAG